MDAYRFGTAATTPKPKKRALLVGINYVGRANELSGCVNDVVDMRAACGKLGYEEFSIVFDGEWTGPQLPPGGGSKPTKSNMIASLQWLVKDAKKGDKLLFHYSGHGSQIRARIPGSEASGFDSVLVPVDYDRAGVLRDDELRALLVEPLRGTGASLRVILDCCHSGTGLDLRYNLSLVRQPALRSSETEGSTLSELTGKLQPVIARLAADLVKAELTRLFGEKAVQKELPEITGSGESDSEFTERTEDGTKTAITAKTIKSRVVSGSSAVDIIALSGCGDVQTSADASFNSRPNGALTYYLLSILRPAISSGRWPFAVDFLLDLHRQLCTNGYDQVPQLSSESPVNSATTFNLA